MAMVDATVMALLHQRVPLTLLCDLLDPSGPSSAEIMAVERGELAADVLDDRGWLVPA
jgi:hypothetical protein